MEKKFWAKSKTIIYGIAGVMVGAAGYVVQYWDMLTPSNMRTIDEMFGPGTVSLLSLGVIVLRLVTAGGISWRK